MKIELIIARYNEDLRWTLEEPFCQFRYLVYNKGTNDAFEKSRVLGVRALPNVGRCDHTYLYHLASRYDQLADIVVFLPGSLHMGNKRDTAVRLLNWIAAHRRAAVVDANRTRDVYELFRDFTIDEWGASDPQNRALNAETRIEPARLRPFGRWFCHHFGSRPGNRVPLWWNRGLFSVSKWDVLKRPRELYWQLVDATGQHSNPETAHYMERAWGALFHPLLFTQVVE